jgi:protein-S-isoprenylcysteine O-methyltransferase Ste14
MYPGRVILLLWLAWVISWVLAAFWRSRPEKRAGLGSALPYRIILILGYILLFPYRHHHHFVLFYPSPVFAWAAVVLSLAGFAFTWWARLHLGALWSGTITKKTGHRIVDSGPYGIVRHPIYTGLIWASFCTLFAFLAGISSLQLAGFALLLLGFWMKARLEEFWLRTELGAEAYDAYRARVPMLLPFGPVSN